MSKKDKVKCEACDVLFVKQTTAHRFCTKRCHSQYWNKRRQPTRRLANKQRYSIDMEYRTRKLAASRAWWEQNKVCIRQRQKEYRAKNRRILKVKHRKYYVDNRDVILRKEEERRIQHRELFNARHSIYNTARRTRELLRLGLYPGSGVLAAVNSLGKAI